MFKLCVFVPQTHTETVKDALFAAGAGRYDNYDRCCWQTAGQGQFRPLPGSHPAIGSQNQVETVAEDKLELICTDDCLPAALRALRAAHPYETPAFEYWRINEPPQL